MLFRVLPLIAGIVPVAGVSLAYWLGVRAEVLPDCIPYLDGCTSISSTGRHMPGSLPFRASLYPQAAFLMFVWWTASAWLSSQGRARYANAIQFAGLTGAVALIVYVTFLGTKTEFYEIMRQFGIYLYFLGTVVAQTLFTLAIERGAVRNAMGILIASPWVLGIANLLQKELLTTPNNFENRIEWIVALAMQLWFVLLFRLWTRSGFRVSVTRQ